MDNKVSLRIPNFLDYADDPVDGQLRMEYSISYLLKMMLAVRGEFIDYSTLDIISGHAANLHYDRGRFWVYDVSPEEPVSTALKHLGWAYQEYAPRDVEDAVGFTVENIRGFQAVLARWMEPIVFYGYDVGSEEKLLFYSPVFAPEGEGISKDELEMKWWKWADFPGANSLTILDSKQDKPTDYKELATTCIKRTIDRAECGSFMGSPAGLAAYEAYRDDLADLSVDFVGQGVTDWGCFAIYQQWTSRRSSMQYFRRVAPMFGGRDRQRLEKAATYYEYCLEAWLEWEKHLGRNWRLIDDPGVSKEEELKDFYYRWRNTTCRLAGAQAVDQALKWERKAIDELKKIGL